MLPASTPLAPFILNSLTGEKELFIPSSINGKGVKMYICGPTVYEAGTHLGHARVYLAFDILRRILEDYFNYSIFQVMNITNVDDKIIIGARTKFLLKQYLDSRIAQLRECITNDQDSKNAKEVGDSKNDNKETGYKRNNNKLESKFNELMNEVKEICTRDKINGEHVLKKLDELNSSDVKNNYSDFKDIMDNTIKIFDNVVEIASICLRPYLDEQCKSFDYKHEIFQEYADKYEAEFHQDMLALGIRPPSAITRVTEYIPNITNYVKKIIDNGFAYIGSVTGSIYFDVQKFISCGFRYNKFGRAEINLSSTTKTRLRGIESEDKKLKTIRESNINLKDCKDDDSSDDDTDLIELDQNDDGFVREKKHPKDFSLWKAAKINCPHWSSIFGSGAPSWSMECVAMANDLLSTHFDIHAGGCDLKYWHHTNEIAQAEAFNYTPPCSRTSSGSNIPVDVKDWVNYFLHGGHLNISGRKMSKSLKNFITIREALKEYTPQQLRFFILLHQWHATINYSKEAMDDAIKSEKYFKEFFLTIDAQIRNIGLVNKMQKWNKKDWDLHNKFENIQIQVHNHILDNFNYPSALIDLASLISETHKYLSGPSKAVDYKSGPSKAVDYKSGPSKAVDYKSGPSKAVDYKSEPNTKSGSSHIIGTNNGELNSKIEINNGELNSKIELDTPKVPLLTSIRDYVCRILSIFGVKFESCTNTLTEIDKIVDILVDFRDNIRHSFNGDLNNSNNRNVENRDIKDARDIKDNKNIISKNHGIEKANKNKKGGDNKENNIKQRILTICDNLRDDILPSIGIRIEDGKLNETNINTADKYSKSNSDGKYSKSNSDGKYSKSMWKIEDPEDRKNALKIKQEKQKNKLITNLKQKKKDISKWKYAHLTLVNYFLNKGYKSFDSNSIPDKNLDGKEFTQSALKKIKKEAEKHLHVYNEFQKIIRDDPLFLSRQEEEIDKLEKIVCS